jgi:glycosyltransferase involved in cell wall biosynthesis
MIRLANTLAKSLQIPVVPHFMDDWPSTFYAGEVLSLPSRIVLNHALRSLFRRVSLGMAISPYMAEAYQKRFGLPFEPFMNCTECLKGEEAALKREGGPVRLAFMGGLHLGRMALLEDFEAALRVLRLEGRDVDFQVFAPLRDLPALRARYGGDSPIQICGTLPFQEIPNALAQANVLVHLESFEPHFRRYTLLSLSTKIPQYLAAGRPVLVYGPPDIGSSRYILETGTGQGVSRRSIPELAEAIRSFISDVGLRETMGVRALEVARTSHNADLEQTRFAEAIGRGSPSISASHGRRATLSPGKPSPSKGPR